MTNGLKYRERMSSSVDKGLHKGIYNYSIDSGIPLSKLLDEAIEDFLKKHNLEYVKEDTFKRRKK